MKKPEDYRSTHMVLYEEPKFIGWTNLEVLKFLKSCPWDEVALAYVHSLRPTSIRVTTGCIKLDASAWRVTVYINKKNIIRRIEQEVEVGLPEGVENGSALHDALKYGINSPQVKWHQLEGDYLLCKEGYFKLVRDEKGKVKRVPYPGTEDKTK